MGRSRWVRLGLAYLAVGAALVGLWALPFPKSWFEDFPGMGMHWASAQPPYNEHLVRDVGALYLGFTVLFVWAAFRPVAALIVPVCVAWVVVQVPHLAFHLSHDEGLARGDWLLQAVGLVGFVVVAAAVAVAARPRGVTVVQ